MLPSGSISATHIWKRFHADRRTERFKQRFRDAIGGSTEAIYEEKIEHRHHDDDA